LYEWKEREGKRVIAFIADEHIEKKTALSFLSFLSILSMFSMFLNTIKGLQDGQD